MAPDESWSYAPRDEVASWQRTATNDIPDSVTFNRFNNFLSAATWRDGTQTVDFAIIGAQKSASTSLQKAVSRHPEVYMPRGETAVFESAYYSRDLVESMRREWAHSSRGRRVGIKRPDYLALPEAPINIARHFPATKFVAVLRNPADRALSAYYHYVRYGFISPRPHEDGLADLLDRARRNELCGREHEIMDYGFYARSLARWYSQFDPDDMLVIKQEDLLADQIRTLDVIASHIGLDGKFNWGLDSAMEGAFHPARLKIWGKLHPLLYKSTANDRLVERNWLTNRFFGVTDRFVLSKVFRAPRPRLSTELRRRIIEHYAADLVRLRDEFNFNVDGWMPSS